MFIKQFAATLTSWATSSSGLPSLSFNST